jgi:hypothetical protein
MRRCLSALETAVLSNSPLLPQLKEMDAGAKWTKWKGLQLVVAALISSSASHISLIFVQLPSALHAFIYISVLGIRGLRSQFTGWSNLRRENFGRKFDGVITICLGRSRALGGSHCGSKAYYTWCVGYSREAASPPDLESRGRQSGFINKSSFQRCTPLSSLCI